MKKILCILIFGTFFLFSSLFEERPAFAQNAHSPMTNFLIDQSKPYVYLEIDHIGPRKPLIAGEPTVGLWMRLRNNCNLPIVIVAFGKKLSTSSSGSLNLVDEVMPTPPAPTGDTVGTAILYQPDQEGLTDIFVNPNGNEAAVRGAEDAAREMHKLKENKRPHGYNSGVQPGVERIKVVPPGGIVTFGVPISHVAESWHFEIPFRLAIKHQDKFRQPYSYVSFFWDDLSPADRSTIRHAELTSQDH
jgi:hypothetical protein